jgi:hypothetical protein
MTSQVLAPDTVLQKTPQGAEEIATRKLGLAARLRSLLILVDGKLDVAQLLFKCKPLGLSLEHLQTLVNSGLCEVSAPPPPAAEPARRAVRRSLALARLHLLELMDRFLGANSEPLRVAIRAAQTHAEVLEVLELSLAVVHEIGGADRALAVRERVLELLPE